MSSTHYANLILGTSITKDDYETELQVVICPHPEAEGHLFCPICGIQEQDRVRLKSTLKKEWRKYGLPHLHSDRNLGSHLTIDGEMFFGYKWSVSSYVSVQEAFRVTGLSNREAQVEKAMRTLGLKGKPKLYLISETIW